MITKKDVIIMMLCIIIVIIGTAAEAFAEVDAIVSDEKPFSDGDRIWFCNMSGGEFGSEMILVESGGRYGLIDTGNRYQDSIEDFDGTVYGAARSSELSCQTYGRNGRDAMIYIVETLGVNHLDFIISTHSHSDHIGGIPEIADLVIIEGNGEKHSLIDSSTLYLYKSYRHINNKEDDLKRSSANSWHNQAFSYQALKAMMDKGAIIVDVSFAGFDQINTVSSIINNELQKICKESSAENLCYDEGNKVDHYDDKVSFKWANMSIDLYNLFSHDNTVNENVNSIATVITVGDNSIYSAGDINVYDQTEQKIAKAIYDDHGSIELVKASHHGYNYSNSKFLIDAFKPRVMVITSGRTSTSQSAPSQSYKTMKYYAQKTFGTEFFEVGASEKMLVSEFGEDGIHELTEEDHKPTLISADKCFESVTTVDGWSGWYQNYDSADDAVWYYFIDGKPATGWQRINGNWYFFDEEGLMLFNTWIEDESGRSWLTRNGSMAINKWVLIDDEWYFFKENGYMAVNEWTKDSLGWMWMNADGRITKNKWIQSKGEWYYLNASGYMASDEWAKDSSGWMYMNSSGKITKNAWTQYKDDWYYLKGDGYMATGSVFIGAKSYKFGSDGKWLG